MTLRERTYTHTSSSGTDTLYLTIRHSTHSGVSVTAVEGLEWHDSNYTASGTYIYPYINEEGCPSTDTLHLVVHHATHQVVRDTACDYYHWHDSTYRMSGTFLHYYMNADSVASCDTLHLTLSHSVTETIATVACGNYYWAETDSTYWQSCTDTLRLLSAEGCDSLRVLSLTLFPENKTLLFDTVCQGVERWWHSQLCRMTGDYRFDTLNAYGCDSTVVLHLEVADPEGVTAEYELVCGSREYHLTARTAAPYVWWYAEPADSTDLLVRPPEAYATPRSLVRFVVRADLRDTLFCPSYDTLWLGPPQLPSIALTLRPEMLTVDNLTLYAEAHVKNASWLRWEVDGRWLADNKPTIVYHANPIADSVRLSLTAGDGRCEETLRYSVPIIREELFAPNIFAPDRTAEADGVRLFRVWGSDVKVFEMTIYNRQGREVFHSERIEEEWDGTHDGKPCPQGGYVYCIRYRPVTMQTGMKTKTGTVTLIR